MPDQEVREIDFSQRPWKIAGSFGPYEIEDLLNVGGMGTVYRVARRDAPDGQRYALKVIRNEIKSDRFLSRFERERSILSQLNHPHIVKFIDGGETAEGVPYLVMEFVEGRPITEYCLEEELDLMGRLRLFEQACRAVEYLHERDFVHRDLKPSNIFVTDEGSVKLLDFGVAKSFADPGKTTSMGLVPFTPEYASPEQILGSAPQAPGDVYSLGLILYRLITGSSPFPDPITHTRQEFVHRVLHSQPAAPSVVIKADHAIGTLQDRAELARKVSRGMDAITLRALQLYARERYQTAGALAGDVRRYLEN